MSRTVNAESDVVYAQRATAMANFLSSHRDMYEQSVYVKPRAVNECGTVACVAGWSGLALRGAVEISTDGTLVYAKLEPGEVWDPALDEWVQSKTLYSGDAMVQAQEEGTIWLGLSEYAAELLFSGGLGEEVAIEILRRLGDGRLSRAFTLEQRDAVYGEVVGPGTP